MKLKKLLALALATLALTPLTACQEENNADKYLTYAKSGFAYRTEFQFAVTDKFNEEENKLRVESLYSNVVSFIAQVENSISVSVQQSYVNQFNSAQAGETVEIDKITYEILSEAKRIYQLTEGYYNPAVYYAVDMYGFKTRGQDDEYPYYPYDNLGEDEKPEPKEEYITAFKTLSQSFANVTLTQNDGAYYATKPQDGYVEVEGARYNLKIDLGGIGKGYTVDCVNAMIDEAGFKYGFFNFGASSIYVKSFYGNDSGDYTLDLGNPRKREIVNGELTEVDSSSAYLRVYVQNSALSTSGDYEQFYIKGEGENAQRISHLFNPKTGKPIQTDVMAATVIGGTAAEGDALTTALCAMGSEQAVKFINEKLSNYSVAMAIKTQNGYGIITNMQNYQVQSQNYTVLEDALSK